MTTYEYRVISIEDCDTPERLEVTLNSHAKHGWRAVDFKRQTVILEREDTQPDIAWR